MLHLKVGFSNFKRFDAFDIKENPRLGCSTSHLKCLQYAKDKKWDMVMIVEDDIIIDNELHQDYDYIKLKWVDNINDANLLNNKVKNNSWMIWFCKGISCRKINERC